MTKAIVFDAGGVLIDLNLDACKKAFRQILGFEKIDVILDPCHQKGIYGDMEEGKITTMEFRSKVLAESRPGSTPEMVDACMSALLTGMPQDKVELLKKLGGQYDLYILSNNNEISWARMMKIFVEKEIPLDIFKDCFISSRMGMLKPDIRIYQMVVEKLGIDPSQILFIDDSMSNVEAAGSLGINAVYYKVGEDLAALIEKNIN
ncbi:MAG: HAD family phosphatase [Bacteroidales bacterium]|nr:HAD family phosphatase [Bacteroidales bacterium]